MYFCVEYQIGFEVFPDFLKRSLSAWKNLPIFYPKAIISRTAGIIWTSSWKGHVEETKGKHFTAIDVWCPCVVLKTF